MARLPQLLIVLALLGATAAAFAFTERVKLERSPITGTKVDRVFSPVCECARNVAVISFVLRRRGTVTVDMLDGDGRRVRRLVRDREELKGRVAYTWDGRNDLEQIVDEGVYRPRVELEERGRTIVLPNPIRVDTTAPRIRLLGARPQVFSPDGDGRRDRVTARYETNELARAMMLVDGRRRVLSKFRSTEGQLVWFGRVNGRPVRPGHVRDPAARVRPRRQPLELAADRPRGRALHRARSRAHRGRRRTALLRSGPDRCRLVPMAVRRGARGRPETRSRPAGARDAGDLQGLSSSLRGRFADSAEVVVTEPVEP